jgi:hypothetical protein
VPVDPVILDEFQVTFLVPAGLPEATAAAVRRVINHSRFRRRLERLVRRLVHSHPSLAVVTVRVGR